LKAVVIGGAVVIIASFLIGGRYTTERINADGYVGLFVTDRFSGGVRFCVITTMQCRELTEQK